MSQQWIQLTDAQARMVARLVADYGDGEPVLLTDQGQAGVYVAFNLASFMVDTAGVAEEAG